MEPAVEVKRSARIRQRKLDAPLQDTLKGLRVHGITAKGLTLANLRSGLQQNPQRWASAANQLIRAAPEACRDALSPVEPLVTSLAAHLAKACSEAAARNAWWEAARLLAQLLTWDSSLVVAADTILPIYSRLLEMRAAAALDLTRYLLTHPTLTDAVFQHPTLLVDLINQLGAVECHMAMNQADPSIKYSDITDNLATLIASRPLQVAANNPSIAALQQLLAGGHAGGTYLLRGLSNNVYGRQLITLRPELVVSLAGAMQAPGTSQYCTLCCMDALVPLASSPDSSPVVLAQPACCRALVEGMAKALRYTMSHLPMDTDHAKSVTAWAWLSKLVCHEPSRQVLLTLPARPVPVWRAGHTLAPQPTPAQVAAAAAGGGSRIFCADLAAALQRLPPGAELAACTVVSTLLEAAPDQQQLLEALEVPSWLNSISLGGGAGAERGPWAQAVALLLSQPTGKAALWAAPRLLCWIVEVASHQQHVGGPVRNMARINVWQQMRDQVRGDAGYQVELLQGLSTGSADWVALVSLEVSKCWPKTGSTGPCTPTYSVLQLPGLPQALAAACMQQKVPTSMWILLRQLLGGPPGYALFDTHPPLVTAVASLFARAQGNLEYFLGEMTNHAMPEFRT